MKVEWTNKDSLTPSETTKAILVIDTPNNCSECPCCNEGECGNKYKGYVGDYIGWNNGRPSWCKLRPLPQIIEYEMTDTQTIKAVELIDNAFKLGWNTCLNVITGELNATTGETE